MYIRIRIYKMLHYTNLGCSNFVKCHVCRGFIIIVDINYCGINVTKVLRKSTIYVAM